MLCALGGLRDRVLEKTREMPRSQVGHGRLRGARAAQTAVRRDGDALAGDGEARRLLSSKKKNHASLRRSRRHGPLHRGRLRLPGHLHRPEAKRLYRFSGHSLKCHWHRDFHVRLSNPRREIDQRRELADGHAVLRQARLQVVHLQLHQLVLAALLRRLCGPGPVRLFARRRAGRRQRVLLRFTLQHDRHLHRRSPVEQRPRLRRALPLHVPQPPARAGRVFRKGHVAARARVPDERVRRDAG
mmetsp:Transcript_16276/g.54895  ORF Transcript_16276/g.54895 Transcript_16276/m.54895 type:complete len:243 (+) Transcript_16276:837-1565(+)